MEMQPEKFCLKLINQTSLLINLKIKTQQKITLWENIQARTKKRLSRSINKKNNLKVVQYLLQKREMRHKCIHISELIKLYVLRVVYCMSGISQ